jgi:hypothetical protein
MSLVKISGGVSTATFLLFKLGLFRTVTFLKFSFKVIHAKCKIVPDRVLGELAGPQTYSFSSKSNPRL